MTQSNRLLHEKSPYLLQHAHNPVDWYPWGEEAFLKAKNEDKPVLLSIGYSTCHWCHVMEEESFSDENTARVMNDHFVSIKVDREERPDIDQLYMSYVIGTTGSGGWPMTVFLTPERKPFYGGTYFPPENRHGLPGFQHLLLILVESWKNRRQEILSSADSAEAYLKSHFANEKSSGPEEDVLEKAFLDYSKNFDPQWGGFGRAPKFPMGHVLSFLLRYWKRSKDESALAMVEKTLKQMAKGGLYDAIGGGFHRYSTDQEWHVPHFEKMLYDQALLVRAYLEAYQATSNEEYALVARETLDYVLREMTCPEGGFYSAQDADSPDPLDPSKKREGAYYVWKKAEIEEALPNIESEIFCDFFDVAKEGNAKNDPQGEFTGQNILRQVKSVVDSAERVHFKNQEIERIIEQSKDALFKIRQQRPRPYLDDKILVDWNGLMIASFSFAYEVLGETRYRDAAQNAAHFVLKRLKTSQGELWHRYRDKEAGIASTLDDYAFFVYGLLCLYEATFNLIWAREAIALTETMIRLFWDEENKGFFLAPATSRDLLARPKLIYDGAIPSGNSFAALNLSLLAGMTGDKMYEKYAREIFSGFSNQIRSQHTGFAQSLIAYDSLIGPSCEIVASGPRDENLAQMLEEIHLRFIPNKIMLFQDAELPENEWGALFPILKGKTPLKGQATIYVCQNSVCKKPVNDSEALKQLLNF